LRLGSRLKIHREWSKPPNEWFSYTVVGGNPAMCTRQRFGEDVVQAFIEVETQSNNSVKADWQIFRCGPQGG